MDGSYSGWSSAEGSQINVSTEHVPTYLFDCFTGNIIQLDRIYI